MANGYLPVQENVGILFMEDKSFSFFSSTFQLQTLYQKEKTPEA